MTAAALVPLLAALPARVQGEIRHLGDGYADFPARLSEIRLRAGHYGAVCLDGRDLPLPFPCTPAEMRDTLAALSGGALYAHTETLRDGYLTAFGCRIGVAGRAVTDGGRIVGLTDPTSLVIRLPRPVRGAGDAAVSLFRRLGGRRGILVYAPPGVGKTTLLRDAARTLSGGRRVALLDTRGELDDPDAPPACRLDVLRGYPLPAAIEIATRTLAPDLLVCDEIGSRAEAEAILAASGCGVPLLASAHGGSAAEVRGRAALRPLFDGGVFAALLGVFREAGGYVCRASPVREEEGLPCDCSAPD